MDVLYQARSFRVYTRAKNRELCMLALTSSVGHRMTPTPAPARPAAVITMCSGGLPSRYLSPFQQQKWRPRSIIDIMHACPPSMLPHHQSCVPICDRYLKITWVLFLPPIHQSNSSHWIIKSPALYLDLDLNPKYHTAKLCNSTNHNQLNLAEWAYIL